MMDLIGALEAILFAAGEAVPAARLSLILGVSDEELARAAEELSERCEKEQRGVRVLRLGEKLQMCSAPEYASVITRVLEQRRPPMLSQSALEALAIVAYFLPVTRAYIDQVRGVDSSYTVGALLERGLIEACGRLDVPGRPTLFRTTDAFLRVMNLRELSELPPLPDMTDSEGAEKLQRTIDELRRTRDGQISLSEVTGTDSIEENGE